MIRAVLKRKFVFLRNSWGNNSFRVFLFLQILLIAGCARHVPLYHPLAGEHQIQAKELFARIQKRPGIKTLDGDVTVTWSGYGRKFHFTGELQAAGTGRFRLSGLDPLGRPVFLLVIHDPSFTFINTRQSRGYTGPVDSDFLHQYIPAGVTPATLFELLTAQLPDTGIDTVIFGRDDRQGRYWFIFPSARNFKRMAEVDAVSGRVLRQLIVDASENPIIDIHYDGYPVSFDAAAQKKDIFLPAHLRIEGASIPGFIAISIDKIYADNDFPDSLFILNIPKYYNIIHVK